MCSGVVSIDTPTLINGYPVNEKQATEGTTRAPYKISLLKYNIPPLIHLPKVMPIVRHIFFLFEIVRKEHM